VSWVWLALTEASEEASDGIIAGFRTLDRGPVIHASWHFGGDHIPSLNVADRIIPSDAF
jgi:hypothetical protein